MQKMQKRPYKRKVLNLGVKREFQLWLLVRILGVVVLSSLVAVAILYLYSRQEIAANFYTAHIKIRRISDLLFPVMVAGAAISVLSGIALALFLPQKVAGPVYRVQKGLDHLAAGDLTDHIVLRKGDAFRDLADSTNRATTNLKVRINEIKELQQELDQLLNALEHREAAALTKRQGELLAHLRTRRDLTDV